MMVLRGQEFQIPIQYLYPISNSFVNQRKRSTMLLSVSALQTGNQKGKRSSGQSLLFAGTGYHGPVYCFNVPVLERLGESGQ